MFLEPLENRLLLSVSLIGIPDWVEQGPAPTTGGQASAAPDDAVSGAIEALAAHPTNADILYAGAPSGGIWKTTNSTSATPTWTPLTDQYPTLAISDLAFSPLDATNNTLFAGTGGFTSGGPSGPALGALRTTDGGSTWVAIGSEFSGERVRSMVPTAIGTSLADQVVLVATIDGGGVYRSTDGGDTFTFISGTNGLPFGSASHLVPDPGNINRFYAAIPGQGVFRSDDGGVNWVGVNATLTLANDGVDNDGDTIVDEADEGVAGMTRIELSVSPAAGNPVYAALIGNVNNGTNTRPRLEGVFRSTDSGVNWTVIGTAPNINPGGQAGTHFSILADRTDPNVVYVGGDRQSGAPFVGELARGDASSNTWTDISDKLFETLLTAPHADSRDMVFDANGDIVEADDGGIFRLNIDEFLGLDIWTSLNRNLGVGEFYSAPYDHVEDVIFGGTQDTGSAKQNALGSLTWDEINQGDGGTAGVGYGDFGGEFSVQYTMGNNFGTFARHFSDGVLELALGGQLGLGGLDATDSAFNRFSVFPYEVNTFSGARLVIGGINNLYESTDFGDTLTIITPVGVTGVTALAYGGSQGGTANPDVIYAGFSSDNNLYLRTTSGGAFSQLAAYPGTAPIDIVMDPDDWAGVYVTDGSAVYHSPDAGATWTTINTIGLSALTGTVRTIEVFSPSATPGDEILLAGGNTGVLRTRNPGAGASALWTEFGAVLPNSPVQDIQYDGTDDILVASAYGRGVWTVASASTFLPVAGVVQIDGDDDFPGQDDIIKLIRDENVPSLLEVFLNNLVTPALSVPIAAVEQINVNGLGGNDTLMVESTNGLINVVNGIRYDGDGGFDQLQLLQTDGPTLTSDTYSVGPDIGSGVSTIVGAGMAGTQTVFFEDLSPVLDLVPAPLLTVNATPADNAITYVEGSLPTQGLVTIDEHESIEFANKTELSLNAGGGIDTVSVNNASTPTGLTDITVDGGDPSGGDALIAAGVGAAVTVATGPRTISGATGAGGAVEITYAGIEILDLSAGIGNLTFSTTGADDTVVVTPGTSTGANSGALQSSGAVPQISFANSGTLTANLAGGSDALVVNGSSLADTVAVGGAAVAITGRRTVNYTGVEALTVNGHAGSDTFNVTPATAVAMFIDGGDPVGALPGDLLNIIAGGGTVTYNAGPETDEGSFEVGANQPVSFDHVESFGITGSGPAVINATNGPDAITVIARDGSTHAGTDGEQDFTASVNAGPELLFIDVASLTVNALGGSDEVVLRTPAPNNAAWNVQVTIDGGPPSASDRLVVETPGGGAETAVYTPSASDGGTLNLSGLTSLVTITQIEEFLYDGEADDDSLTVAGTAGDDALVHTPGANDQAGSFQVNGLLPISYQNLGSGAILTVDGAGSTDTLIYNGTAANDTFTIGLAGQVSLNSRLVVNTTNVEALTLEGFDGDDTFTLVPAISASAYPMLNFNGGAGQDRVNLVATAGDDDIAVSGQVVSLGGVTVNSSGVEDIRLDALDGDDLLTYNGVSGVTEDITVSSSGVAGGGQVSVPGVTLVNFSNVERIDVNGNTPTPTETDSLTFAGTNAVDMFQINLAAAGDDADPILKLQDDSSATLLTLRNYTNFDTLRVLGLDGADTFNVLTDPVSPVNRNLFVDGGLPAGKKKSTDKLNVFYTSPRPSIIHSAATQDPDAGLVDLDYGTARFLVQYDGIEQRVIRKA